MLSIGAAFGVTVAVFQWGWGASLIGIGKEGPIEAWAPMMLFASFVLGDDRGLKLFGLAAADLIDATIVRLVLVPAAMELMGAANWWAPGWLVRYLPTIRVESAEPEAAA